MSIEDIQRINTLAQDLLDQGIADSREEAVQKAQEMLNKEIVGSNVEIKETGEKQNIAATSQDEEQLRNMIARVKDQVDRQFAGFKQALIALENEINAIKDQLKTKGEHKTVAESSLSEEKVKDAAVQEETKEESNPRTGNQNQEDVSVEKMFYFGNK